MQFQAHCHLTCIQFLEMAMACLRKWWIPLETACVIVVGELLFIGSQSTMINFVIELREKFSGYLLPSKNDHRDNIHINAMCFNLAVERDRQAGVISRHASLVPYYTNTSLSRPAYRRSQLQQDLTNGVLNCQTGQVVRTLDRPGGQKALQLPSCQPPGNRKTRSLGKGHLQIYSRKMFGVARKCHRAEVTCKQAQDPDRP